MCHDAIVGSEEIPAYSDFILPAVRAVAALGGSARSREVVDKVLDDFAPSEELLAVAYANRPNSSVLEERIMWGRSYAKLIGALESPSRGVFLITPLGKELLAMPADEGSRRAHELDREFRRNRPRRDNTRSKTLIEEVHPELEDDGDGAQAELSETQAESEERWQDALLSRLHRLTPEAFEEFVLYLLRLYGLELERIGSTGDEGIDGIGTAPISPVLSSRVAVQVKRYNPDGRPVGRDVVALFQRDAQTKGAERAILVTLGRFSEPARKAAIVTTPTVDLIDGERLAELILEKQVGVRLEPRVNPKWFDRFD